MIRIDKKIIIHETCAYFGIPTGSLKFKARGDKTPSRARYIIWYFLRRYSHYSYKEIGRAFEVSHTTVVGGYNVVQKKLDEGDEEMNLQVDTIYKRMMAYDE